MGLTLQRWDALPNAEREWWRARRAQRNAEHAPAGVTPHSHDVCGDAERIWFPQMVACRVEMETEAAQAAYRRLHEKRSWHDGTFSHWAEEPDEGHPYHFMHGVRIWVTEIDHGLGGHFTSYENPFRDDNKAEGGD